MTAKDDETNKAFLDGVVEDTASGGGHVFASVCDKTVCVWDGKGNWYQVLDGNGKKFQLDKISGFGHGCFGVDASCSAVTFILPKEDGEVVVASHPLDDLGIDGETLCMDGSGPFTAFLGTVVSGDGADDEEDDRKPAAAST